MHLAFTAFAATHYVHATLVVEGIEIRQCWDKRLILQKEWLNFTIMG